jgi:hypothetical protein
MTPGNWLRLSQRRDGRMPASCCATPFRGQYSEGWARRTRFPRSCTRFTRSLTDFAEAGYLDKREARFIGIDPDFRFHESNNLLALRDGPMLAGAEGSCGKADAAAGKPLPSAESTTALDALQAVSRRRVTPQPGTSSGRCRKLFSLATFRRGGCSAIWPFRP